MDSDTLKANFEKLKAEHAKFNAAMERLFVDYIKIKQELIELKAAGREELNV